MDEPALDFFTAFQKVAIALGLGLLVGLQRERSRSRVAGVRTFAILTVLGTVCGLLGMSFGGWIVGFGLVAVALLLVIANLTKIVTDRPDPGMTTEMAALTMYGVGAYLTVGHTGIAIALGGAVAVLLHLKKALHEFIARIGEPDFHAVMQFVLISLVILPVLPDRTYGPYQVLNPRNVWLMVVLIVGLSLGGYIAYRAFGRQAGTFLAGVLGGLISSTATAVSYARRSRAAPDSAGLAALVIMIASTVAFARVLVEIGVVAPQSLWQMAPALGAMFGWMALISAAAYVVIGRGEHVELPTHGNPAELKPAIVFGALYAGVLVAVAAAKEYFGSAGLYGVAVISGLTDMDAITLSTSRLVASDLLGPDTGWRVILLAALANLAFKAGVVALAGPRRLLLRIAVLFGAALAGGLLLLLFWPAGD